LFLILALFWVNFKISKEVLKIKKELIEKEKEKVELEKKWESFFHQKKDFKNLEKDVSKVESAFLKKENPLPLIKKLEEIQKEMGIQTKIDLTEKEDKLNFKISSEVGSFSDFLNYLNKIENLPFLSKVTFLNVNKGEGKKLNFEILLEVYLQ
jgi:hypothetical protein